MPVSFPIMVMLGCGLAFPAFRTAHSVESEDRALQEQCLKYWAVISVFFLACILLDGVLRHVPLLHYLAAFIVVMIATQPIILDTAFHRLKQHLPPVVKFVKEQIVRVTALGLGRSQRRPGTEESR